MRGLHLQQTNRMHHIPCGNTYPGCNNAKVCLSSKAGHTLYLTLTERLQPKSFRSVAERPACLMTDPVLGSAKAPGVSDNINPSQPASLSAAASFVHLGTILGLSWSPRPASDRGFCHTETNDLRLSSIPSLQESSSSWDRQRNRALLLGFIL